MNSCKNCEGRKPGCHSKCERYTQDRIERESMKAEIKKNQICDDYIKKQLARSRRTSTHI